MDYIFAFAGIPAEIFDDIKVEFPSIVGKKCTFISRPAIKKNQYTLSDKNYYINEFASLLEKDHENRLSNTKFGLVYINHPHYTSEIFSESFFPFLLKAKVDWEIDLSTRMSKNESKNRLYEILKQKVNDAKISLHEIRMELTQKANKTPLLLPLKNFSSPILVDSIKNLYATIVDVEDKKSAINETIQIITNSHPFQRIDNRPKPCLVDDRNVEYHSPGKSLHGISRPNSEHPKECLLSGKIRLGAKFSPGFHYDCMRGTANLSGIFWGCHEGQSQKNGNPHLNIAPNDHIRE